jgi:uncharacterized membrane protein YbaN (DUF454 family)
MRKALLIVAGFACVGLGAIGVFLPILPTTPFLLLAAACFIRSSDRFYNWLVNHRWFGAYIRNYREHRAITARAKAVTLCLLWATLAYSGLWIAKLIWIRILLGVVGLCVTVHILALRTLTADMLRESGGESNGPTGG